MTNTVSQPVTIASVTAQDGDRVLRDLQSDVLPRWMKVFGSTAPGTVLGPGQGGLVWLDVVVDSLDDVPDRIEHDIAVELADPSPPLLPKTLTESVAPTDVQKVDPIVIGAPLDGPHWLDGNSCCEVTAHRAAVSPLNGELWAPERFAIDFVALDADGKMFKGDRTKLESYAYYGANVHAVADGKVVAVRTDLPEQTAGANPSGLPIDEYGGNHVVQDIGNGHYAFYAHLQTGDGVKVKVGDDLTKGQVVGLLGNSGNTDGPHLHFHVMDGIDPLVANGLPFEIDSFELESRIASDENLGAVAEAGAAAEYAPNVSAGQRKDESPLYLDIMKFDVGS
ncbi:M23 family metallopeptidase [Antrihabitans spumae]|uniref:M23 family metallopeptidase n=1 Tax=Antrihabitans spumae TaxID=3373370 RepID=A0ABW7KRL9_9NOCA